MRALLIIIIIALLGGAGYYWYTQNQTPIEDVVPNPFGTPTTSNDQQQPNNTPTGTPTSTTGGTTKEFTVSGQNFSFAPATMNVKQGDTVKITFKNTAGTHDLRVDGYNVGTKVIQGGQEETFTFVADKAGSFEYYCSVGSHRQMGMKGTLTVTP
jgi:plastocyanin